MSLLTTLIAGAGAGVTGLAAGVLLERRFAGTTAARGSAGTTPGAGREMPTAPRRPPLDVPKPIEREESAILPRAPSSGVSAEKLVEECVDLFNELERHVDQLDAGAQEVAELVLSQLHERLERCGVEVIWGDPAFDQQRHLAESQPTIAAPGASIVETLQPGFAFDGRVLRRAKVRLEARR